MISSKEILSSTLKAAQMGQTGIRSVMQFPLNANLRHALRSQMDEYDTIERKAQSLAFSRGWDLTSLDPALKAMTSMTAHMRLSHGNTNSKVAAMVITGNTRGMVKSLKNLHQYSGADPSVEDLARKLLEYEKENIVQMQGYV